MVGLLAPKGRNYTGGVENMLTLPNLGDFFNLEGGANAYEILEVRIWQRGSTTPDINTLVFERGVITSPAGTAVTVRKWDTASPAATVTPRSLPTTDVDKGTADMRVRIQWNILQEVIWLPTPDQKIVCGPGVDFGIHVQNSTAYTGTGVTVTWREYGA